MTVAERHGEIEQPDHEVVARLLQRLAVAVGHAGQGQVADAILSAEFEFGVHPCFTPESLASDPRTIKALVRILAGRGVCFDTIGGRCRC